MNEGIQVVIDALKKHHGEALAKAEEFRELAKRQARTETRDLYLQQAEEEEMKARGYLRHAEILSEAEILPSNQE